MALSFGPINRFSLCLEGAEHMVRMVFGDIIVDPAPLGTALGPRLELTFAIPVSSLRGQTRAEIGSVQRNCITNGRQTNCLEPVLPAAAVSRRVMPARGRECCRR